jgi:glycosyltransferase involved in cell wall biosynthesis
MTTRESLLWVTNIPTPYRAPLWEEIAARHPLQVALLADTEPNREWIVDLRDDRYEVIRLRAKILGRPRGHTVYAPSSRLLRVITRRPRAVVLDGWESPAYLAALCWARVLRVPVIASYRSTQATHRYRGGPVAALRSQFFRQAAMVLTAGPASTAAVRAMAVPASRIVEGFNTVDVARFAEGAATARAVGDASPGHHFLYVGQLIRRKNVDGLLHAFATVRAPDDRLTVVGTGPLDDELRKLAAELGVTAEVHFAGHLDGEALVAAYAAAHTLVMPSHEEVWGLVANEALSAGLHAVVSDRCGITPSIAGMPGVLVTPPETAALAEALRRSRDTWIGWITDHPVTRHTPASLAKIVVDAVRSTPA